MASQLGQCGKSLRGGDADEATGLLQQLAADLEDLQSELDELQTLDEASTQIAQAKSSMSCEKCGGGG
jgi:hypothetical protein